MKQAFLIQFQDIIERHSPIVPEEVLRDMEEWDSLAALSLVSMVDDEYGVVISSEDLEKVVTVQDMIDLIKTRRAQKGL